MKPDNELREIFLYHFGVDIAEEKYREGVWELANFFKKVTTQAVEQFYSLKPTPPQQEIDNEE